MADQEEVVNFDKNESKDETAVPDETVIPDENVQAVAAISVPMETQDLCHVAREGDMTKMRLFVEFSKQNEKCKKRAAEKIDKLDETSLSPLHYAARHQQLGICIILLTNIELSLGANITDDNGRTPIHASVRSNIILNDQLSIEKQNDVFLPETDIGDTINDRDTWLNEYEKIKTAVHPLICFLIKANGDVNKKDKYQLTPLHHAVSRNNLLAVKQLIEMNADFECEDRQGIRPLHLACKEGYYEITDYLLSKGALTTVIDDERYCPIHFACQKGNLNIVQLIKSTITQTDFHQLLVMKTLTNATCLHLAVESGNILLVTLILNEFNNNEDELKQYINQLSDPFGTPFHITAKYDEPEMIRLLYDNHADPYLLNDSSHSSALHIACQFNRCRIVQELKSLTDLKLFEIKDRNGQTPLSTACLSGHLEVIDVLLSNQASINSTDNNRMNPLMLAASTSRTDVLINLFNYLNLSYSLTEKKTLLNQTNKEGKSLFLIAVRTGNIELCEFLLTQPFVQWNTSDKRHWNALHIAARYNYHQIINLLGNNVLVHSQKNYRHLNTGLQSTNSDSDDERDDITTGKFVDAPNDDNQSSPLHIAAFYGNALCIQELLHLNANPLQCNATGQIPLHNACSNGYVVCVELLLDSLKNASDFKYITMHRNSPLITACQHGYSDIVQLLLTREIGIDYEDEKIENPLEIAIRHRQNETVDVLLEHPYAEQWLQARRFNSKIYPIVTPIRTIIRTMPYCMTHTLDKLVLKSEVTDADGNRTQKTKYNYRCIDDYFGYENEKNNLKNYFHRTLYTKSRSSLYRNHPFIIAIDNEQYSLLEHPLAQELMKRKWELYRKIFYLTRLLSFLFLFFLTIFVLTIPAPNALKMVKLRENLTFYAKNTTNSFNPPKFVFYANTLRWIVLILAACNIFKILVEIILYGGLRVIFAQVFGFILYSVAIVAFPPFSITQYTFDMTDWQWQCSAVSVLLGWLNVTLILRSVPFIGDFIVMFESILLNFSSFFLVILPFLIAFTVSTKMIFYNEPSFFTFLSSLKKCSVMVLGEYDYEKLFFSKQIFPLAPFIFFPFIIIMTILMMNLLLGLAIGDIAINMQNARQKANAYRIRELIYIETTLPIKWLKNNITEDQIIEVKLTSITANKQDEIRDEDDNDDNKSTKRIPELQMIYDIVVMLCNQAKSLLTTEINFEQSLKKLLTAKQLNTQLQSMISVDDTII